MAAGAASRVDARARESARGNDNDVACRDAEQRSTFRPMDRSALADYDVLIPPPYLENYR
jgi:hypothetical protein